MLLPTLYINCFFFNGIGKFQSKLFGLSTYIFSCKISFFLFLIPILLVDNKIRFIRVFFRKAYFRFSSLPFAYQRYTWNWNVTFFFYRIMFAIYHSTIDDLETTGKIPRETKKTLCSVFPIYFSVLAKITVPTRNKVGTVPLTSSVLKAEIAIEPKWNRRLRSNCTSRTETKLG